MSKNKKLRAVIPIVLCHGKEEWTAGLNFQDLFEIPVEMKRLTPGFEYRFCNFQHYHDEPVMGGQRLRIALLLLKTIFTATAHSIGEFEKFLESTVHGGSDRSSEILKS